MATIRKGMILCAGLGTRLLPLTEHFPKPLVPVLNIPNLLHNIFLFREAGIHQIALNLYHLGDQIRKTLGDGSQFGVRLFYSAETKLLGTGGGVKNAEAFFENESFALGNCDFITDISLKPFIAKHLETGSMATMVLFQDEARQQKFSKVGVDDQGRLCQLPKLKTKEPTRTGIFTGIHILSPEIFNTLKAEPSGINDTLYPHLMKHAPEKVRGEFAEGKYWYDTGELTDLWMSSMNLLDQLENQREGILAKTLKAFGHYESPEKGIWVMPETSIPSDVEIKLPVLVGKNIRFGKNTSVGPYAIIGDNCEIAEGTMIQNSVLLPGAKTEPGEQVARTLLFSR